VYALAGAAVTGALLEQAALHGGPLSISQPALVIIDPFASIALSGWLFDERFTDSPAKIAIAIPLLRSWPPGSSCCHGQHRKISPVETGHVVMAAENLHPRLPRLPGTRIGHRPQVSFPGDSLPPR
jgi:hypothetical protein